MKQCYSRTATPAPTARDTKEQHASSICPDEWDHDLHLQGAWVSRSSMADRATATLSLHRRRRTRRRRRRQQSLLQFKLVQLLRDDAQRRCIGGCGDALLNWCFQLCR